MVNKEDDYVGELIGEVSENNNTTERTEEGQTTEAQGAVNKNAGGDITRKSINSDEYQEVELDRIVTRSKGNEYEEGNILDFGLDIEENGLIEPITCTTYMDGDVQKYIISAGETRYKAYCLMLKRAKEIDDKKAVKKFEKIPVKVIDEEAEKKEEGIYNSSNIKRRKISNFQRVAIMFKGSAKEYFGDKDDYSNPRKKHYISFLYRDDYSAWKKYVKNELPQANSIKWNESDVIQDIVFSLSTKTDPVSYKTIETYLGAIKKLCPEMLSLIKGGTFKELKDVEIISKLSKDDQQTFVKKIKEGKSYSEAINGLYKSLPKGDREKAKKVAKNFDESKTVTVNEPKATEIKDVKKYINNTNKNLNKKLETFKADISELEEMYKTKKITLNANQRKYLNKAKTILNNIEELIKLDL